MNLKKTATGPDQIPFWIWKDLAGILTPAVTKIWNNPHMASFMEEIINPIPKVEIPKENGDFRGINITPVIARGYLYKHHVKNIV